MIELTLATVAEVTGATLVDCDPDTVVTGYVEFDSRAIGDGDLFVCLPGARADGHDFAGNATAAGAVASLSARTVDGPHLLVPHVDVPDTGASFYDNDPAGDGASVLAAMDRLARFVVDTATGDGMTTIGVTGSAGKTSTKDMIASVVRYGDTPVVAPPGSFNNEIGMPYTALRVTEHTRFLVAEMSARGIGHIQHLTEIAPPHVGVVLNVGTAHLGEFGSRANIAAAKSELVQALSADGVAVLNADDDAVAGMASCTNAQVMLFTTDHAAHPEATVWAEDISLDDIARARFSLHIGDEQPQLVQLQVFGLHQVSNAVAAAACGHAVGLSPEAIAAALNDHTAASANRMDVTTLKTGTTIINDSYNANPDSMRAGIAALAYTASGRPNQSSFAVLGQMNELGEDAISEHEKLAELLSQLHIDHLIAVGQGVNTHAMGAAAEALGVAVDYAASSDAAVNILSQRVQPGDVILVKASYSEELWFVAEALIERDQRRRVL